MKKVIEELDLTDDLKATLYSRFPPIAQHMVNC